MRGSTLVFPDRFLDPVSLIDLFRDEGVTFTAGVPSVWIALLQYLDKTRTNLDGLRVVCVRSVLSAGLYDGLPRHGIDTNQGWGMTETSPVAAVATMKSSMPESGRKQVRLKAGLPI